MKIIKATEKYEDWLGDRIPLIQEDLELKHEYMASDLYDFMRATFYRWIQIWLENFGDLDSAPVVLAVGDLHTENFGTWRDVEGRLIWGINDFDEAYLLPYTFDLVRLATSAYMAISEDDSSIEMQFISNAILAGYRKGLKSGGEPYVLAEYNTWLRDLMLESLKDPLDFWEKLDMLPTLKENLPQEAKQALENTLPRPKIRYRPAHRTAGLGSLGRRRYVALIKLCRSYAAREVKELTASACLWALGDKGSSTIFYTNILNNAVRCPDPFLKVFDRWVARRLSPDYSRVELTSLSENNLYKLLEAMGWETANVHLGSEADVIKEVLKDLKNREEDWLSKAAEKMWEVTSDDFNDWQDYWEGQVIEPTFRRLEIDKE
ncbi:MAG: DUF2252 family protein [Nostoc sp.]|uniref:DUF2252 family protein n=1 Tax=Nostoc sp. TaxID=1180 RepID=UPI002FF3595A